RHVEERDHPAVDEPATVRPARQPAPVLVGVGAGGRRRYVRRRRDARVAGAWLVGRRRGIGSAIRDGLVRMRDRKLRDRAERTGGDDRRGERAEPATTAATGKLCHVAPI